MKKKTKYHHGNLADALLQAGVKEARVNGIKNLGVTYLANKVDVSPMAIYRHFPSGENLKVEISQQSRQILANRMLMAASQEEGAKKRFQAAGRAYIQFALEEPGLFSVAFVECEVPPRQEDEPSAWLVLQDLILDLCNEGYAEPADAEEIAYFAWSTVHGYASLAVTPGPCQLKSTKEQIDELIDRVWLGVIKAQ